MTLSQHIAQHLFDVHEGDNWTDVNLKTTLKDITWQQAEAVTSASKNSIAALVHHIGFYTNVVQQRLEGTDPPINDKNGFDHLEIKNDDDWKDLVEECFRTSADLVSYLQNYPDDKLFVPVMENKSTAYKSLHGLIEHAHYHLGQIVLIKHLVQKV